MSQFLNRLASNAPSNLTQRDVCDHPAEPLPEPYRDPEPPWLQLAKLRCAEWWATVPEERRKQPFKYWHLQYVLPKLGQGRLSEVLTQAGWLRMCARHNGASEVIWVHADYVYEVMASLDFVAGGVTFTE